MAKRLTNTEKYNDSWFVDLEAVEKLLFYYLIDHVDNAGFYEVSLRHIQFHLGVSKDEILGAIKGLRRGLLGADSDIQNGDKIYLKNFLKHQKMLPLNPFNSYHINALRVFETNFRFVEKHPFLQNLIVKGTKTKDKEIIKNIDTNLIKYLKENQGLTSPIVEVKVIVEVEEDVEEKEKGKIEKSKIEENVTQHLMIFGMSMIKKSVVKKK
ncbi:hypothetical protein PL373_13470 [Tenacibaculum maritimum]|nr:hypothetical protein [Tenacibaculum maritimum]